MSIGGILEQVWVVSADLFHSIGGRQSEEVFSTGPTREDSIPRSVDNRGPRHIKVRGKKGVHRGKTYKALPKMPWHKHGSFVSRPCRQIMLCPFSTAESMRS